ncbi:MAG: ATP-binding protein [Acidobacteria bacterium]|nr:ATP-binding protein [Acidobacteriota bacterium]
MAKKIDLKPISQDLIVNRLKFENPWWVTGHIDEDYSRLQPRLYFGVFYSLIEETDIKRAVVLTGPRRVGKTVMMHQAIAKLMKTGVTAHKICFIGIDNPIYLNIGLEQLFHGAREAVGGSDPNGWFVFFDEIQYLKNWEQHLKVLVDSYPHTKFIVSGSAAAALKVKSAESGAGRFTDFMLPPLTFREYIHIKNFDHLMQPIRTEWKGQKIPSFRALNITEVNRHFVDYINFGGYPEVIFSERIRANPSRYIKSDIVDKVLLRDLPSLYGIRDVQELNSFFTTLAYYSGNEVSLEALSSSSGVDKNQLRKYLEYLEAAFLIRVVHRIDDSAKRFRRATAYKVFLTNPSLRSALFSPLQPIDEAMGNMVETAIFSQWLPRDRFTPWYARWARGNVKGEVDMVGLDEKKLKPVWAVEVKWSNRFFEDPRGLKSLLHFCSNNELESAVVTTIDKEGTINNKGIALNFIPAAVYAYIVGENTLRQNWRNRLPEFPRD